MERDVQRWVDLSSYDFETAEAMLRTGRYLYVLFCCQQALEKRLKGLAVLVTKTMPPKTHDLLRLISLARIELDEKRELFLRRLTHYYIETRYPEEVNNLTATASKELAESYFAQTGEAIKWLDSLLK
ncbi:MAG: HEPN domain-containing protein [Firmicutes bacterium]|nr:HEPN domain-containing protein [Bacillota bacterium]